MGGEASRETCQKKRISVGSHSVLPTDRQTADSTKRGFGICGFLSEEKLRSWKLKFFLLTLFEGIFHKKMYRSNLMFQIVMRRGIADFGWWGP